MQNQKNEIERNFRLDSKSKTKDSYWPALVFTPEL